MIDIPSIEIEIKALEKSADYIFMFQGLLGLISIILSTFILSNMQEMSKIQRFWYGLAFIVSIAISVLLPIKSRQIEADIKEKGETIRNKIDKESNENLIREGNKHEENLAEIFADKGFELRRVYDSTSKSYVYELGELKKEISKKDFGIKEK